MEHWKDIKGFEGLYQVSDLGNVRSCDRAVVLYRNGYPVRQLHKGRVLIPQPRRHGYLSVWLYKGETRKQYAVHRLVAEEFCEKKDGCNEVNHKNEDKTDNRAENLEWCDRIYNVNYGSCQQRRGLKQRNGPTSRRVRQLDMDGNVLNEFPSLAEAYRQTGTRQSSICFMISGRYTHANGYKWEYVV